MSIRRPIRVVAALAAIAALLFAQIGVAAFACPMMSPHSQAAMGMDGDGDCCERGEGGSTALCHAHCNPAQPSFDKSPLKIPAFAPLGGIVPPVTVAQPPSPLSGESPSLLDRATAPPLAVRHCRFLI